MKGIKFRHKLSNFKWELKYAWQRAQRGYDDVDVFGFGNKVIEKTILILEDFIENNFGHPSELSEKEWKNQLK